MGAIGLLHALGRVICPAVFSLIYANTVGWWPQFVFVVLAGCFAVGMVASLFVKPHGKYSGPGDEVMGANSVQCVSKVIVRRRRPMRARLRGRTSGRGGSEMK